MVNVLLIQPVPVPAESPAQVQFVEPREQRIGIARAENGARPEREMRERHRRRVRVELRQIFVAPRQRRGRDHRAVELHPLRRIQPDELPAAVLVNVVRAARISRVVRRAILIRLVVVISRHRENRHAKLIEANPQRRILLRRPAIREIARDQTQRRLGRAFPHPCHHVLEKRPALFIREMQVIDRDEIESSLGLGGTGE